MRVAVTFGLWILAIAAGAGVGSLPTGLVWTGETRYFTFYASPDQQTDAAACERYAAELVRMFGQRDLKRARYYRYRDAQELAARTGTYAAGLTYSDANEIHSTKPFHAHEIVHLVAGQLGRPGAFFQEGLAVALADKGRWRGRPVDAWAREQPRVRSVRWMVEHFERLDPEAAYPLAASFVKALLESHGTSRIGELFKRSARGPTRTAFEETFGQTLEAAERTWRARVWGRKAARQTETPEREEGGTLWSAK